MDESHWKESTEAMPNDTPRTNALLREISIVKFTTFEHIVHDTNRFVAHARQLERENTTLRAQLDAGITIRDSFLAATEAAKSGDHDAIARLADSAREYLRMLST